MFSFQLDYVQYLECMQTIITCLLQDATTFGVDITKNTQKCVKLGQQCMERMMLLLDSLSKPQVARPKPAPLSLLPQGLDILSSFDSGIDGQNNISIPQNMSSGPYVPPLTPTSLVLHSPTERFPPPLPPPSSNIPAVMSSPTTSLSQAQQNVASRYSIYVDRETYTYERTLFRYKYMYL